MLTQGSGDAVEHLALLLHTLGVIVDATGHCRHTRAVIILGDGVVEALRDPGIGKAEIAGQRRGGTTQIVGGEGLEAQQRADARRPHRAVLVLSAAQRGRHRLALQRTIAAGTGEHIRPLIARERFLDDLDRKIIQGLLDDPSLLDALQRHVKARILAVKVVQLVTVRTEQFA